MGCCAYKLASIYQIEEILYEWIDDLKFRKLNLDQLRLELESCFKSQRENDSKNSIKMNLRNLFLLNNMQTNKFYAIQNSLFDFFIKELENFYATKAEKLSMDQILLFIFPLMENKEENEKLDFIYLMTNYLQEEDLSYKRFLNILKYIIETYTKFLNKFLMNNLTDKEYVFNLKDMSDTYFPDNKIQRFLNDLFNKDELDFCDTWDRSVNYDERIKIIKKVKIWDYKEIRNNFIE